MVFICIYIWFGFVLYNIQTIHGDYTCICNNDDFQKKIYRSPTTLSDVIGYMGVGICKSNHAVANQDWLSILYQHQVGYVQNDTNIRVLKCVGDPRLEDVLTTTVRHTTTPQVTSISTHSEPMTTVSSISSSASSYRESTIGHNSQTSYSQVPPATTAMPTVKPTTLFASIKSVPTTATDAWTTPPPTTTTQTTTIPSTTKATTVETTTTTTARPITTLTPTIAPTTTSTSTQAPTISTTSKTKTTSSTTMTTEATTKLAATTTSVTTTLQTSAVPQTTTTPTKSITTNTPSTTRTTSTLPTTTTGRTTTAIKPTTTPKPSILQGHIEMCSGRLQSLAEHSRELIAQFGQNCYEIVQTGVSWLHAEANCKHYGGHLIHIANQKEQDFIYEALVKHHSSTVWLGLHDRNQEENFEWTSGNPVTYTNWKPGRKDYRYHNSEDCVFMTTDKGQWDDIQCGGDNAFSELFQGIRHGYICQYATQFPSATVNSLDGNTHMCPYSLRQQAVRDKGVVGQYDHSCYELVPNKSVAWQHAEEICTNRGGHLAYINSIQEQTFVQGFLNRYSPNHAVWIGLTDRSSEGRFHWASGASVQFTNWIPGHLSNYVSSSQEDCVVLIPYKNGQWDDIPCGSTRHYFFGGGVSSSGETHPLLCQYRISAGPSLIG